MFSQKELSLCHIAGSDRAVLFCDLKKVILDPIKLTIADVNNDILLSSEIVICYLQS